MSDFAVSIAFFENTLFLQVAEQLIEAEADINTRNAHGLVPLHLAAQNGHLVLSQILVQAGTDLDKKDLIGEQSQTKSSYGVFIFPRIHKLPKDNPK